jgi:hypothetical protein
MSLKRLNARRNLARISFAVISAIGIGMKLETRTIMSFERFHEQQRSGMVLKVVGQIAKPDFFATFIPRGELKGKFCSYVRSHRQPPAHPRFRAGVLLRGGEPGFRKEREGREGCAFHLGQARAGERGPMVEILPVAHSTGADEGAHHLFPTAIRLCARIQAAECRL